MRRAPWLVVPIVLLHVAIAHAQEPRAEQFYYPGAFNWQVLARYPGAARLFNAFDYGHAVLYETLLTRRDSARSVALEREYQYLTTDLLVHPPRFAVAEEAVEPAYARIAWRAKQMFDWAHLLHRQVYDVYADPSLTDDARDALIERLTDYYLSRPGYAFTAVPKAMALMEGQSFSLTFRRTEPKFNGLIWAYHWLQVALYEPFIAYRTEAERAEGVRRAVAHFWSLLDQAPDRLPTQMPMTATVAPRFAARHPRTAVIFDNLHMMHDIISDILASGDIPPDQKGSAIEAQLAGFRDGTRDTMSLEEWRSMGEMMGGVMPMGGPALAPATQPQAR